MPLCATYSVSLICRPSSSVPSSRSSSYCTSAASWRTSSTCAPYLEPRSPSSNMSTSTSLPRRSVAPSRKKDLSPNSAKCAALAASIALAAAAASASCCRDVLTLGHHPGIQGFVEVDSASLGPSASSAPRTAVRAAGVRSAAGISEISTSEIDWRLRARAAARFLAAAAIELRSRASRSAESLLSEPSGSSSSHFSAESRWKPMCASRSKRMVSLPWPLQPIAMPPWYWRMSVL
mmetsp:Transcript_12924/g.32234  ORF Transcript_12924/g.32234 Transcript_12924/m.32234 type:complete len:235 (-) Transcript_12924:1271-1975(-)